MRMKYALKFWQNIFLVGFVGLFIFSLLLHNPSSVEIAAYGETPPPWYWGLFLLLLNTVPILFFITLIFFPLGLLFYHPESAQDDMKNASFNVSSLKEKTMLPAYITTILSAGGLYLYGTLSDKEGMGLMVAGAMLMFFLAILVPINITVWIISMRRSRKI